MHLDLDNVEGRGGRLHASRCAARALDVVGGDAPQTVHARRRKQRSAVTVPLDRIRQRHRQRRSCNISGPSGFALERNYALDVSPATQILTRRTVKPLASGESLTLSSDLFADLVPGTGRVALSVGLSTALDAADAADARSTAIRSAAPSRSPAARCRCSMSTIWRRRRIWRSTRAVDQRIRGLDRPPAGAAGLERLVRAVVGGRR